MHIDWDSNDSEVLLNPRLPQDEQERINRLLEKYRHLQGHVWVSTSGTTSGAKWAALSKSAVLASAKAVNSHLQSNANDRWIHPLPDFHVGGLGIWARSYLSGAHVIDYKDCQSKWNPQAFYQLALQSQATLSALVPAHVHDLVSCSLHAPPSLRGVIVGGGVLQDSLYRKAIDLGWKLLPSYGLTECSSQVATAELNSWNNPEYPLFKILPHLQVKTDEQGVIYVKGCSLLTGYMITQNNQSEFYDPKENDWYCTGDLGSVEGQHLRVVGRLDTTVKIGGENVDVNALEKMFDNLRLSLGIQGDLALIVVPDDRLGNVVHLASTVPEEQISGLINRFHADLLPFAHIRKVHYLESLPRTALQKLRKEELLKIVSVEGL